MTIDHCVDSLDHCVDKFADRVGADPLLRVQIISDVRFFREGLAELLARETHLFISGTFAELDEALRELGGEPAPVVLLDEAFPGGLAAVGRIRMTAPHVLVVAIAVTETVEEIVAWAEAGVAGYIPKTAALAEIAPSLVDIASGRQMCADNVVAGLLRRLSIVGATRGGMQDAAPPMLTTRERQIAQLVVTGMSNKDIARRLNIGVATAKTHVHHLLGKLNLERRSQAASWLRDHGRF